MTSTENGRSVAVFVSAAIALLAPLLTMPMGSPLYTERWPRLTLMLWISGLVLGLAGTASGSRLRPFGGRIALGTSLGALSFVLAFIGLAHLANGTERPRTAA